jgi:acyl-coenzyme A synthetase/AMP-(fatty) acid ligase
LVDQVDSIRIRLDDGDDRPLHGERPWIDVGDIGWIAPDGRLFVLGRAVDLDAVNLQDTAVRHLSPVHEVEHLLRLEWDTTDAAAVLVEDFSGNSKAQIWVGVVDCKNANAETLAAVVRPRGIEHPIRIFDLPAIPRGTSGKVQRSQLKSLMLAAAGKSG